MVAVTIRAREGDLGPARLVALDRQRIRVRRDPAARPLASGAAAEVVLADPSSGAAVVIPAVAGAIEVVGGAAVLDLVFLEAGPVDPRADRRASVRVVPAPDAGLEVYVEGEDPRQPPVAVRVVDLGEGGVCVELPAGLLRADPRLQVLLPDEPWPLLLPAQLRHQRALGGGRVRCGFAFAWARATDAPAQRRRLAGWVAGYRALVARRLRG